MAGSGFRPLTNIPYCCLPQESGPCLSTSVGDRPLRSPSHRSLGGPSPRQPANGTHARPRPHRCFIPQRMPSKGTMAYYPAFPPAIRPSGAGCIRVAHPSATLGSPEGPPPVRLACIRPAASVHPEPGSNSSLYYCIAILSCPRDGNDHVSPPGCPLSGSASILAPSLPAKGPLSLAPLPRRRCFLVLASDFQRTYASASPLTNPLVPSESGCKSTTFFRTGKRFFQIFFIFVAIG